MQGNRGKKHYQIAIDGPAGSGKSTIARLIAKRHGLLYIDSGAMYRAVTLYMIRKKMLNSSDLHLKKYLYKLRINFLNKKNIRHLVYLNSKNVTSEIRKPIVTKFVSEVSARKVVREELVERQKRFALYSSVIMDGRDIGSNVFKDADLKIYLTASSYIRAKRRKKDLHRLSEKINLKDLEEQIRRRDDYDSSREISPLCKVQEAIVIDSTNLSIEQVVEEISNFLPYNIVIKVQYK